MSGASIFEAARAADAAEFAAGWKSGVMGKLAAEHNLATQGKIKKSPEETAKAIRDFLDATGYDSGAIGRVDSWDSFGYITYKGVDGIIPRSPAHQALVEALGIAQTKENLNTVFLLGASIAVPAIGVALTVHGVVANGPDAGTVLLALPVVGKFAGRSVGALSGRVGLTGEFRLTETVAKNIGSRPYLKSPLTIREIMSSGKGVPDPGGFPGALRWDVPGGFGGSVGRWELVVDPKTNTVLHMVYRSVK